MIDIISSWAGDLIVSLIIVTILEMLLPDNKTKKYVKTVIGVYIIFCIISPFINEKEIEKIFANSEKSLEKIQIQSQVTSSGNEANSIESLYIEEFKKQVTKQVEDMGYNVKKCDVDIEIDATKEDAGIHAIYLKLSEKEKGGNSNIKVEEIKKVEISINEQEVGENSSKEDLENQGIIQIKEYLGNYYEINKDCIKISID